MPAPAAPKKKSKFFRVATEGATSDGRKIERSWLQQIAETYNRDRYGARIFVEHIRGFHPESGFRAMGDVIAVKVEEVEDGKLALFAQVDPTDEMVTLVGSRQKIYSSIEVSENFADSGKAYLIGLGITDSPASLGTDILAFAAQNPTANPFASRKQAPENIIAAAEESAIEFVDVELETPSILDRVRGMFSRRAATDDARFGDVSGAIEAVAEQTAAQGGQIDAVRGDLDKVRQDFAALKAEHDETVQKLSSIEAPGTPRPASTGNATAVATDC